LLPQKDAAGQNNVESAQVFGMQALQFAGVGPLRQSLVKLGVL